MCRFVIRISLIRIPIYSIIYNRSHSIMKQSYLPKYTPGINNLRDVDKNMDGFGVAWYAEDNFPIIYKSTGSLLVDQNFIRIAKHTYANIIMGHVRSANGFAKVSELNCHPFKRDGWIFCHNGQIPTFDSNLSKFYTFLEQPELLQGRTDSEYIFNLFCENVKKANNSKEIKDAIWKTVHIITSIVTEPCSLNIALSNGSSIYVLRYLNSEHDEPPSLYIQNQNKEVIICSEPIDLTGEWTLCKKNELIDFHV